ncbi:mitochondrial basic amino acids transporter-like isoform X1 [Branchiostoma lanceolatum]|uniref:Mitochondrial basic amino acids transporter n=2 Tax=Branchiostoma lanceolatum TaxID=7740 RepID=A0A8J9ZWH2_BRALA|nr:SLC25A29 [Branchiostoma lanceolatum]
MALDFVAGCLGGAAGVLVGHPFDTVKVRLQTQSASHRLYRGTFHCFAEIIRKESTFGLYKGMTSPLIGLTFINAIVFGVQGNVMRVIGEGSVLNSFLAGSAAGAVQTLVCAPMELAKTRMQLMGMGQKVKTRKQKDVKNSLDCLLKIYRKEGLRGCCRGMYLTLWRETPAFGVYFATYDIICQVLSPKDPNEHIGMLPLMFAGGMSGIASWMSTYPIDVIKSRIQADGAGGKNMYKGTLDCFVRSYQAEGWTVYTRGLNSTLIRAFPVNAATFTVVTLFLREMRPSQPVDATLSKPHLYEK